MTDLAIPDQQGSALAVHQPNTDLAEQMEYARVISSASLLPPAYRGKPADVLIAMGLGQAMGLSPVESLYRIDVIQGKPTASAELIAANVRRAGHVLRVRVDEQAQSVVATIIRVDDPGYEHTVTRDMAWAQQMGLTGKENYKKQPVTMLQWRAVTAVARLACPEALYGVAYTADEVHDSAPAASTPTPRGMDALRQAVAEPSPEVAPEPVVMQATRVEVPEIILGGEAITDSQRRAIFAAFAEVLDSDASSADGRQQRLDYMTQILGRPVESTNDLTQAEAIRVIDALKADAEQVQQDALPVDGGA